MLSQRGVMGYFFQVKLEQNGGNMGEDKDYHKNVFVKKNKLKILLKYHIYTLSTVFINKILSNFN